jgi:hypothetical protein
VSLVEATGNIHLTQLLKENLENGAKMAALEELQQK